MKNEIILFTDGDINIRCEMAPTSLGGEEQISISGGSQSPSDIASGRITEVRS